MTGARPIDGSSSRISLGRDMRARPTREHLLLAAREAARALGRPLGEHREERVDALEALAVARARGGQVRAHLEVVGHGELREEPAALGHVGDAVGHDVVRGLAGERGALEGERRRRAAAMQRRRSRA